MHLRFGENEKKNCFGRRLTFECVALAYLFDHGSSGMVWLHAFVLHTNLSRLMAFSQLSDKVSTVVLPITGSLASLSGLAAVGFTLLHFLAFSGHGRPLGGSVRDDGSFCFWSVHRAKLFLRRRLIKVVCHGGK